MVALRGHGAREPRRLRLGHRPAYRPLPYAWVTVFVFYFFRLRPALVHLALIAVGCAIVLSLEPTGSTHLDAWLATLGTLLVGGMFVEGLVRERWMSTLISSDSPTPPSTTRGRTCSTGAASRRRSKRDRARPPQRRRRSA